MAAIASTLFRGLLNVAIVTLVVAVTWSVYIYREPLAGAVEPVTRLFHDTQDEPARITAPVAEPVSSTESTTDTQATTDSVPAGKTTTE